MEECLWIYNLLTRLHFQFSLPWEALHKTTTSAICDSLPNKMETYKIFIDGIPWNLMNCSAHNHGFDLKSLSYVAEAMSRANCWVLWACSLSRLIIAAWTFPTGSGISVVAELHLLTNDSKSCCSTSSPCHGSIIAQRTTTYRRLIQPTNIRLTISRSTLIRKQNWKPCFLNPLALQEGIKWGFVVVRKVLGKRVKYLY